MEDYATKHSFKLLKDVKKIGFLGFGRSNRAVFEYLKSKFSFDAVIRDERESLPSLPENAEILCHRRCFEARGEDVIFLSPSVRRERAEIRRLFEGGAIPSSDAELFFSEEPKSVFAVSGSDGKSTTAAITESLLLNGGHRAVACGNFGTPMTPLLDLEYDAYVTELSSFTLRYLKPKSRRALITNVTPNHLNWHESFGEYIETKAGLFERADECVYSYDCAVLRSLMKGRHTFGIFSIDVPFRTLSKLCAADVYYTAEDGWILRNGVRLASCEDLKLPGRHNVKNLLGASALADGFFDTEALPEAMRGFKGLSHRCELVGTFSGIRFFDSSIDSTPERTRATLASFDKPLTVILGGKNKGLSYEPLAEALSKHAEFVILTGENAEELNSYLKKKGLLMPVTIVEDLGAAVRLADGYGKDTLLSPGATSYDRFKSFEERGDVFASEVFDFYRKTKG